MKFVLAILLSVLTLPALAQSEHLTLGTQSAAQVERASVVHHKGNRLLRIVTFGLKGKAHDSVKPAAGWVKPKKSAMLESLSEKVHPVHVVARHADGTIFSDQWTHNLRTTGGADWQSKAMSDTAAQPASCNYVAVTNDSGAPAAGDCAAGSAACTLTSEIASNGLSRAIGTFAHTNGTASYTVTKTFSATGTQASQKSGLFNASSSGTMCFEATYSAVTVNNGDTLQISWTVNF